MRLRSPLWDWGWGWSTHVLLSGSFVWPSLPAYFFAYIAFLPVHNCWLACPSHLLSSQAFAKRASTHPTFTTWTSRSNWLIDDWFWHVCREQNGRHAVMFFSFFLTMLSEIALRLLPNVSEITEKQKKSLNLLLKRKAVLGWLPTGFGRSLIY